MFRPRENSPRGSFKKISPKPIAANDNTPPLPNKKYEIVYGDCPWSYYGNQNKMGAAGNHYGTMTLDEIKALGFLLDETTHMAMLLADYIDTYPDAIIKVDDADVKWLDNGEHRNVNQYHFRKFIKPRLINFDDNHTVLPS